MANSMNRSLIVGGETVPNASDSFPAFVWSGLAADGWGCGAALVHSDIVVSAAHCAVSFKPGNQRNYVGPTWITGANATAFPTQRTLIHPRYNWASRENDIIIIKLKGHSKAKPFEINKKSSFPVVNSTVTVIGFGWVAENGGPLSNILKKVDVQVFPFEVCKQIYRNQNNAFNLTEEMHICAGTLEGGKDGCASDSGTPLLVGNKIVGITEDGLGCGRPGIPAYYTRVSNQAEWISESICLLSSRPPKHCKKLNITWTIPPTLAPSPPPSPFPTKKPTTSPTLSPTILHSTVSLAPAAAPSMLSPGPTAAPSSDDMWRVRFLQQACTFLAWLLVAGIVGFLAGRLIMSRYRRRIYEKIPSVHEQILAPHAKDSGTRDDTEAAEREHVR